MSCNQGNDVAFDFLRCHGRILADLIVTSVRETGQEFSKQTNQLQGIRLLVLERFSFEFLTKGNLYLLWLSFATLSEFKTKISLHFLDESEVKKSVKDLVFSKVFKLF